MTGVEPDFPASSKGVQSREAMSLAVRTENRRGMGRSRCETGLSQARVESKKTLKNSRKKRSRKIDNRNSPEFTTSPTRSCGRFESTGTLNAEVSTNRIP